MKKRVELTEARRQEAKQAKQKKQDRRLFKQQAQRLFDLIDKYGHRPLRLHVWSDNVHSSSGGHQMETEEGGEDQDEKEEDLDEDNEDDKKLEKNSGTRKKKGRPRNFFANRETPKKVHPRSKEAASPMQHEEGNQVPLCFMSQFFLEKYGVCSHKKGAGGLHENYLEPLKSLASVVNDEKTLNDAMTAAQTSIREDSPDMPPNMMEFLRYKCLEEVVWTVGGEGTSAKKSDALLQQLNQNETTTLASIVYVVAGDKLVFDRYREGVFMNERDILLALGGHDDLGRRRISVGSESEAHGTLHKLPGSILEHTLTFLPDLAVAVCCCVCKDWNNEIGKASPNLWQELLDRRKWPCPVGNDQSVSSFRKMFIGHYTAKRNVDAIRLAMTALTTRKVQLEREMCYQDFSTRKQTPSVGNECVTVQIWSEGRILVGYRLDCSLRLFEAAPKPSNEKMCKEIVYQRLDPYAHTKRRHCLLLDVVLDDESIGSLCQVTNNGKPQHILIVVNREEFLLGDNSTVIDKGAQPEEMDRNIIDIGEAMINYVLTSDTADHRQLQLFDFLQDRGDLEDVEVLASERIIACGSGRFMVEVSISIPSHDDGEDENPMRLIDRKLVIFSASIGAIVWVGDSCDLSSVFPTREQPITLTGVRRILPGDYRATCNFLVASSTSPSLSVGSIDPSGNVMTPSLLAGSLAAWAEIVADEWQSVREPYRLVLLGHDYAIAADRLEKSIGEGVLVFEKKTIVSLYPLYRQDGKPLYRSIELANITVQRMALLGDDHLCLVCREFGDFVHVDAAEGVQQMNMVPQTACMIIIHVSSCQEIYRTDAGFDTFLSLPILASSNGNSTIGCALNWSGISITGDDVRHMKVSHTKSDHLKDTKKKKKISSKPGNAKGRKKDGFNRGMSSRG